MMLRISFIFSTMIFAIFYNLVASDTNVEHQAQWKQPLVFSKSSDALTAWYLNQGVKITEEKAENLRKATGLTSEPNIATDRLIFLIKKSGLNLEIPFDFEKIFLSGARPLNIEDINVSNALDFLEQTEKNLSPGDISIIQKKKIDNIMSMDHPKAWSVHSEAHIVLYLEKQLPIFLKKILEEHENIKIKGFILQIMTLKDSCDKCLILLENLTSNFGKIVKKANSDIVVSPKSSNFVVTVGRKEFLTSRQNMLVSKTPLDLSAPANIVTQTTWDGLK